MSIPKIWIVDRSRRAAARRVKRVLDASRGYMGNLGNPGRVAIRDFVYQPTEENWNRVYRLVVNGGGPAGRRTVWQLVSSADAGIQTKLAPGAKWNKVPDRFTVLRALEMVLLPAPTGGTK